VSNGNRLDSKLEGTSDYLEHLQWSKTGALRFVKLREAKKENH
jgi:hypothetical protein